MTQPTLVGDNDYIGIFGYAEQRYEVDVADMKFGFAMQYRPFSFGEGIRGMRRIHKLINKK